MEPNPYEAPKTPVAVHATAPETSDRTGSDLLRDWEYRRLWLNGILVVVTLVIGVPTNFAILERRFWAMAVQGAIGANICFCVGTVANWYLSRIGFNQRASGLFLFWLGTALATVLAAASIAFNFIPLWQDW
jgi:hypothetical protein